MTELACRLLDAPIALVTLVGVDGQFFKSACGLSEPWASTRTTPLSHSICKYVVADDAPFVVEEARAHDRLSDHPAVGDMGVRAYLGVPLRTPGGETIGALCAIDREPRSWGGDDVEQMEVLAGYATTQVALRAKTRALQDEERARAAEEVFSATVVNAFTDLFFVLDAEGQLTKWNRRMAEVTGYSDEELSTMHATDFFDPQDAERVGEAIAEIEASGEAAVDVRVLNKAGGGIPYELNGRALRDADGRFTGLCGTGRDLTERMRAEHKLRRSEERFRSFVEATSQVVWIADATGRVKEMGGAWSAFTGQLTDGVEGWGWTDALHPEDWERVAVEWSAHLSAGSPYSTEYRVRRHDGVYHWFAVRAIPVFSEDGSLTEWIGTCTDVQEQKRHDEQLRKARIRFERLAHGIDGIVWEGATNDRTGDISFTFVSDRLRDLLGYEPETWMADARRWSEAIVDEDREGVIAACLESGRRGHDHTTEYRVRAADGRLVWVRDIVSVLDQRGDDVVVAGIMIDVTEQRAYADALIEANRQAVQARREAEEMMRAKSALLNNMSHEIRTPLTAIIGFSDVLAEELPVEHKEMVRMIQGGGNRLLRTLNSVLDLAQIESGSRKMRPEVLDAAREARDAVDMYRDQARAKGLVLECEVPADPLWIEVDLGALQRVIANLVSNAIKFTREGRVVVRVGTDPEASQRDRLLLCVEDTGVGMDEAFLGHAFEEFQQESAGLTREHEGSGLGLAIVRGLVELMDGTIEVESERGKGSLFRVRLPRRRTAITQPSGDGARAAADLAAPSGRRVLLVEDNPQARFLVERLLSGFCDVDAVGTAEAAFQRAAAGAYDLLLLDISLRGAISGADVLQRLRAEPRYEHVPAVALTAHALAGARDEFVAAGFDGYLAKPFMADELRDIVLEMTSEEAPGGRAAPLERGSQVED